MKRFLVFSILFQTVFCMKTSDQVGIITYQGVPRRERKCILGPWIHLEDGSVFHDSDRCEIKTCHITAQKAYLEVQSCRYKVNCERQILEPYFPHCCPTSPKCT
uniref:Putative venom peptide n=1 Tax=Mesobuthus gibbosus TaxID=123226 RepID=A0A059UI24_MESGB|nr:putative venom peptide [Mesobuthus gibbosus]